MALTYDKKLLIEKAKNYCSQLGITITNQLGFGTQGMVFKTSRNSAIKVYDLKAGFERELSVYQRLKERSISSIRGLIIPRLLSWDNELRVLEMSIVHVPCILDFGGSYLDTVPDHVLRNDEWLSAKAEEFGTNWEEAQAVIRELNTERVFASPMLIPEI